MSADSLSPVTGRLPTHTALLRKQRGWFFGMTGDGFVKYVFQGNAVISIVVLALITFTIFSDAIGFLPANHRNLVIYRQAGLEYVDIFRDQVTAHSTISRYLATVRAQQYATLTGQGPDNTAPSPACAGSVPRAGRARVRSSSASRPSTTSWAATAPGQPNTSANTTASCDGSNCHQPRCRLA